ncbi:MAG TPA: DNA polymerase III subunit alpha [Armatimonadota bacterium]|nr:DNA polymerase III subunit alpha [Armatimonadota bacterium]
MASGDFAHLHVHTDYSLLDGASRVSDLVRQAAEWGMPALAITDHGHMMGAIDFYDTCRQAGVKPIVGSEVYVAPRSRFQKDPGLDRHASHLTLLAMNEEGYRNLIKMVSAASLEGFYWKPRIDRELLAEHHEGLIVLSGCMKGELAQHVIKGEEAAALQAAQWYRSLLGDRFYLEVQANGIPEQDLVNRGMVALSGRLGIPLVATNDVHYLAPHHADVQDVLLCIQTRKTLSDKDRWQFGTQELWLKDAETMARAFAERLDAIRNTVEVVDRCNLDLDFSLRLPHFEVPAGYTPETHLAELAWEGLRRRYQDSTADSAAARLRYELDVINDKGFASYFLIVWDFVRFARDRGILAQARGSAAGAITSYCLGISHVEPLANHLLFERFLRVDGKKMPDIDVDFPDARRGEVLDYVIRKYGSEHVAQICTINRMGARQAIRDAGRVLGLPVGLVDKISKSVPFNGTVDDAYETAVAETPQGRFLLNTASDLEGLARNAGVHAAGVVISALPLTEVVPLMRNTESSVPTTQFDWRSVERVGLLKMDFLGLNYLTVVDVCLRAIEETTGLRLTLEEVPAGDESTYALLCAGETTGIFQLESDGMRKLIRSLRPREFADLIALVALYRPGPLGSGMADDFVNRKHGRAAITYLTPALEPILARTYGIIVYQEQVMRIAMDLAGFDPINAEGLLKGMGKKLPEVMAKYRGLFVVGAVERSIPGETAARLYDLMAYFAGYGFNASHAAAYALLAYQTAWLKRHYPAHYFLGLLEAHAGDAEKVALYVAEARRVGIPVLPPDVNTSGPAFQLEPDGDRWSILAGLNGVDRVGDGGVQQVIEGRQHGPYRGLLDFCARITDARKLNSAAIASLISCGAFDWTGQERKVLVDALDDVLYLATKLRKQHPPDEIARMDLPAPQPRQRRVKAVEEPALPQPPAETQGQHVFVTVGEGFIGSPAHASLQLTAARHPGRYPLVVSDGKQYEVGPAVEPTQALLARARAISGGAVEVRVGHADDGSAGEPEER